MESPKNKMQFLCLLSFSASVAVGKYAVISINERPRTHPNKDPSKSGLRVSFCSCSSPLIVKQLFSHQLSLPKTCVSSVRLSSSSKVLDLEGCFSSENPYHDHVDSLVWTRVLSERALQLLLNQAIPAHNGKPSFRDPFALSRGSCRLSRDSSRLNLHLSCGPAPSSCYSPVASANRGPAATLFTTRNACTDGITNYRLLGLGFPV